MNGENQPAGPGDVVAFWKDAGGEKWFAGGAEFDDQIRARFDGLVEMAASGALDAWAETPDGALALILVMDQFSRNLFRQSAKAFDQDEKARALARQAIARGDDEKVDPDLKVFFYMPLEHSETIGDQADCLRLCHALNPRYLQYAKLHADVIRRFGRFPHRNAVLGRHTSPAEMAFLDGGGFSAGTHKADDKTEPDAETG